MNRIVFSSFTILCLLSLVFLSGLKFEIPSARASSENTQTLQEPMYLGNEGKLKNAALFLNSTQFDPTIGLCKEVPNVANSTYWLVSDNLLAYHALEYYYPETADAIYSTMLGYGYFRSYKHEVIFGIAVPCIPFKGSNTYVIAQNGTKTIQTQVDNGLVMNDWDQYEDLCIYAALNYYWNGDISQAMAYFNTAESMWKGVGIQDQAYNQSSSIPPRYQTYKLALLLYVSRIMGQSLDNTTIEKTLWLMQDPITGGFHTDYDSNLNYSGSNTNTETTSLVILAYKYEPELEGMSYRNLSTKYDSLSNQANTILDRQYVSVALMIILIVAVVYLAIRRPRRT